MSMGGCYLAVNYDKLNDVYNARLSMSDFAFNESNVIESYTLEQAWDGIRILFQNTIPEILGLVHIESDLGEDCIVLAPHHVKQIAEKLEKISREDLVNIANSDEFQKSDFYWEEVWKNEDGFDELIDFAYGLKDFFKRVAEVKGAAIIFYIC